MSKEKDSRSSGVIAGGAISSGLFPYSVKTARASKQADNPYVNNSTGIGIKYEGNREILKRIGFAWLTLWLPPLQFGKRFCLVAVGCKYSYFAAIPGFTPRVHEKFTAFKTRIMMKKPFTNLLKRLALGVRLRSLAIYRHS